MTVMNLSMPGNPRYQPKSLRDVFGYDHLMKPVALIEIATLETLAEVGFISEEEIQLLTPEVQERLISIPTTEVDRIERSITKHDVLAWRLLAREIVPAPLSRWLHAFLTSYDVLDTANILRFKRAHDEVLIPHLRKLLSVFADMVQEYASVVQIGRTHGQHAVPITVGFWLSTVLARIIHNVEELCEKAVNLSGKISGPVGCHNAEVALGLSERCGEETFEWRVLNKVGLQPALVSTQILPPEYLVYYLHACYMLTAVLGQFGRDCRNLMRTEIAEVAEGFGARQGGSSTMAHKRNPKTFEQIEGFYEKSTGEMVKVFLTLISEHQRDLTGSSVGRDFPTILINLIHQIETLLKKDEETEKTFLERIFIDRERCLVNLSMSTGVVMAEPAQLALVAARYEGDAHEVVQQITAAQNIRSSDPGYILGALESRESEDESLAEALAVMDTEGYMEVLTHPMTYTGNAEQQARDIADAALGLAQRI